MGDGLPQFAVEPGAVNNDLLGMNRPYRFERDGELSCVLNVHDELRGYHAHGPKGLVVVREEYLVAFLDRCIGHGYLPCLQVERSPSTFASPLSVRDDRDF